MSEGFQLDEDAMRRMRTLASRLSEKDRRAYAAVEAYKLGRGGVTFIANLFGMSPETIKKGRLDLDDSSRLPAPGRQRHEGAGRKGVMDEQPGLEDAFVALSETHTAGDPMNADAKWTDLQPSEICTRLREQGFALSKNTARSLLANAASGRKSQQRW